VKVLVDDLVADPPLGQDTHIEFSFTVVNPAPSGRGAQGGGRGGHGV